MVALDGISFAVEPGQVFGFLGANGAGKTTTMRIILNILRADSGTTTWNRQPTADVPRRTWGYLPEERGLYPRMEALEQLAYFAELYDIPRRVGQARAREWLARFRIEGYDRRRAEELSKGNQQKVQFIAAILHEPAVRAVLEPVSDALADRRRHRNRARGRPGDRDPGGLRPGRAVGRLAALRRRRPDVWPAPSLRLLLRVLRSA